MAHRCVVYMCHYGTPLCGLCVCVLQSLSDYVTQNHGRLLSLWHTVVAFRRQFTELKDTTDHELAALHAEFGRIQLAMNSACLNVRSQLHNAQRSHQVFIP